MRDLGVGIVGTGRISDLHAIEYLRGDAARIVAVCDRVPGLAAGKAAAWGVPDSRAFATLGDLAPLVRALDSGNSHPSDRRSSTAGRALCHQA